MLPFIEYACAAFHSSEPAAHHCRDNVLGRGSLDRVLRLKLGFVGVVNRSQQDVNEKRSIAYARAQEMKFFARQPAYQDIAEAHGTEQLCARLSRILVARIQKELPTIAGQIHRLIAAKKKELREMGGPTGPLGDSGGKRAFVTSALMNFSQRFKDTIDGGGKINMQVSTHSSSLVFCAIAAVADI